MVRRELLRLLLLGATALLTSHARVLRRVVVVVVVVVGLLAALAAAAALEDLHSLLQLAEIEIVDEAIETRAVLLTGLGRVVLDVYHVKVGLDMMLAAHR